MKIALQMDPMPQKDIEWSTSLALAAEAARRGYAVYHYLPQDVSLHGNMPFAHARRMYLDFKSDPYYRFDADETLDLNTLDALLIRQDPPFDMAYLTNSYILDHVGPKVRMINPSAAIRNAPEKLLITHFQDLVPPTLITSRRDEAADFFALHGDIIIKPLYLYQRKGIHKLFKGEDFAALWQTLPQDGLPLILQPYLHEVKNGDKRILLFDGDPIGAFDRILSDSWKPGDLFESERPAEITARDREICARLKPVLQSMGLFFVGLDIIGGYVTELNVTSPGGLRELDAHFPGTDSAKLFWDKLNLEEK